MHIRIRTQHSPTRSRNLDIPGSFPQLALLGLLGLAALCPTLPAQADTSEFRGMNWAVLGDNFSTSPLVLHGLSNSDSYTTVQAKANAVYDAMEASLGVNTVRLPINTHTVGTAWWDAYRATIDAATARGFKVILAYWEDGAAAEGRITDLNAFNTMWEAVVAQYGTHSQVYFEPMNEPYGYEENEWLDLAASWLSAHPTVPQNRILIGGTGYSMDLRPVCTDSRFDGTRLSVHHYAFFYGEMSYWNWQTHFEERLGDCATRAIVTEFGAPQDTGLDYGNPASSENFVRHIRAVTQTMHDESMGGVYWPGLGGKVTSGQDYDYYSMFTLDGSGTALSLTLQSASGGNRIRYGWGDDTEAPRQITNRNSSLVIDVQSPNTADGANVGQYSANGSAWQAWFTEDVGAGYVQLRSQHSGKCLDLNAWSVDDGANVQQWACHGGANQHWAFEDTGDGYVQLVNRHSGLCLEVSGWSTANEGNVQQWDCHGGNNQQWSF